MFLEYVTKASSTDKAQNVKKTKPSPAPQAEETEPEPEADEETAQTEEEDHSMQVDEEQPVYPKAARKKKEKKEVQVGKNGLKKKRVIKTRKEKNKKGYTGQPALLVPQITGEGSLLSVNVDYSSYESVDEEEPELEPVKKPRKMGPKVQAKIQVKTETPASGSENDAKPPKPKPKAVGRAGSKQNLLGFFGKK